MSELSYSLHLSSDKNRKPSSKNMAKNNTSGSTSLSNNAIQNAKQLSRVDKHNYRKYDNNSELIEIIKGTTSLYEDVKNLYLEEFEEARLEYNKEQENKGRNDRKITDYFKKISDNTKNDLACEIIIELGDKKYWDTKDDKFKHKMTNVFKEQLNDLQELVPDFKIASAIIHYDETSPHMHIVGVPIKEKNKNGMSKQVGKSDVFTKESLIKLQDKMRILCIEEFNQEYNLSYYLKEKQKGRNRDINVKDMDNYSVMKKQLESNKEKLENANNKSKELSSNTNDIKSIINNLKTTPLRKDNYILKEEDKDKLINYLDKVDKTNIEYQNINELSITLNNVNDELTENKNKIKYLTESNNALNIRIDNLKENISKKDKEITKLKQENTSLKQQLSQYLNLFTNLIKFLKSKMFHKDRDKYFEFSKELYTHGALDLESIKDINNTYINGKNIENKQKEKDDYSL